MRKSVHAMRIVNFFKINIILFVGKEIINSEEEKFMRPQQLKANFDKLEAELKRTKAYEKNPSDYPEDFPVIRDKAVVKQEFEAAKRALEEAITKVKKDIDDAKKYIDKNKKYYDAGSMAEEHGEVYRAKEKQVRELTRDLAILKGKGNVMPHYQKESMLGTHRRNVAERNISQGPQKTPQEKIKRSDSFDEGYLRDLPGSPYKDRPRK